MPNLTQAEYLSIMARRSGPKPSGEPCPDESELHQQIIAECRRRGWLAFHGSMAHRTFRTPGEPDFVILRDGGRVMLVECKAKGGKLSTDQQAVKHWAERLGHSVLVVWSFEEFLENL